jgi:hypothetical protein
VRIPYGSSSRTLWEVRAFKFWREQRAGPNLKDFDGACGLARLHNGHVGQAGTASTVAILAQGTIS